MSAGAFTKPTLASSQQMGQHRTMTTTSDLRPTSASTSKGHSEIEPHVDPTLRVSAPVSSPVRSLAARRDDAIAGFCGVWMIGGLFLDGWAHRNQKPETFFSPWHGILYSGFTASALWLLYVIRSNQKPGISWRTTMPVGYGFRAAGVGLFGVGAIGDLIWHSVFGIEVSIEALLSPSHLVLLSGGLLMAIGPIVSTLAREPEQEPRWSSMGPVVGTVAFIVSLMQFFIMYLSPFDGWVFTKDQDRYAFSEGGEWFQQNVTIRNVADILVFTVFMVLPVLWLVRNVKLPRGSFLAVWFLPCVLQSLLDSFSSPQRLIGPFAAAVLAEFLWPKLSARFASKAQIAPLALLLAAMSFLTWIGLLLSLRASNTLAWQPELWFGVPTFAALLSALIVIASSSAQRTR
jgi:hypothetical protein